MEQEFLETDIVFGLVMKGDFNKIQQIKEYLSTIDDIKLIYQKSSFEKLYITNTNPLPSGSVVRYAEHK